MENNQNSTRNFSLASFIKAKDKMIATNDRAYSGRYSRGSVERIRDYSPEEIDSIISNGSLEAQQRLSRNYFYKDGFYRQIILHYATLLKYAGLLIPNPGQNQTSNSPKLQKRYSNAIDYVEKMNLPSLLTGFALRALIDGSYYGLIVSADKNSFAVLDLPVGYACSNFKDIYGNDIVEFDVAYFNSILDEDARNSALSVYPKFIKRAYEKWRNGKTTERWVKIPAGIGLCFPFFDGRPPFVSMIPTILQYDKAVETEQERELEEIRKIIVQKVPHLQDGTLLFEPTEAEEMHAGAVGMLRQNEHVSVLTSYCDVDAIVSRTAADGANNTLERMLQNIYSRAGVSGQVFSSTGSSTLESSLKKDISIMMTVANKFARFVTNIINDIFANNTLNFKYIILPVGIQNEEKYVSSAFKLASSGYSFLVPAVASGFSQKDILNLKDLENNVLKMGEKLIPLQSSYTQSAAGSSSSSTTSTEKVVVENPEGGRPQKAQEEKAEKTIQNETSLDNQTGGENA